VSDVGTPRRWTDDAAGVFDAAKTRDRARLRSGCVTMFDSCRWKRPTRLADRSGRQDRARCEDCKRRLSISRVSIFLDFSRFGSICEQRDRRRAFRKVQFCAKKRGLGGPLHVSIESRTRRRHSLRSTPIHLNDVLRSYIHVEFEAKSRLACEGVVSELHDSSMTRDSANASERIAPSNRAISIIAAPDNG